MSKPLAVLASEAAVGAVQLVARGGSLDFLEDKRAFTARLAALVLDGDAKAVHATARAGC